MDRAVRSKPSLTALQAQVLARYASGLELREIAVEIHYSQPAMWALSRSIRKRLCVETLAAAILPAYQLGYLTLPDADGVICSVTPYSV